jgi:hypothetical protein
MYSYSYSDSLLEEEEEKLKNMIDLFITKFYMLNPNVNHLNNFLSTNVNYVDHQNTKLNYIIKDISIYFYAVFDAYYKIDIQGKKEIGTKIMDYAINIVEKFITLIENAPEKIPINEKMVAGVNKTCIDVIQAEDSEKLHEVLEDLDSVIFILPAEYMGRDGPLPVNYKYLAYTYKKNYITSWFNTPARIKYCDTDELNTKQQRAIPYILCPLNFNCDPAYIKLWEIVHIIHSKQRIFYVLYSHSEHPKHKCMKGYESHEMLKIAICDGDDCWKWDDITQCIKDSEPDKIKIQTECNMKNYENYIRRMEMLKKLKRKNEEILENPNTVESVRERETQYRKYRKIR